MIAELATVLTLGLLGATLLLPDAAEAETPDAPEEDAPEQASDAPDLLTLAHDAGPAAEWSAEPGDAGQDDSAFGAHQDNAFGAPEDSAWAAWPADHAADAQDTLHHDSADWSALEQELAAERALAEASPQADDPAWGQDGSQGGLDATSAAIIAAIRTLTSARPVAETPAAAPAAAPALAVVPGPERVAATAPGQGLAPGPAARGLGQRLGRTLAPQLKLVAPLSPAALALLGPAPASAPETDAEAAAETAPDSLGAASPTTAAAPDQARAPSTSLSPDRSPALPPATLEATTIVDYRPGSDLIEITIFAPPPPVAVDVVLQATEDRSGTEVLIAERLRAILDGVRPDEVEAEDLVIAFVG